VLPLSESCDNDVDDDCNGLVNDEVDLDGDGWTNCEGDCCDSTAVGCLQPELVNPGAYEAVGNSLDDDCDGVVDNDADAGCAVGGNPSDALSFAEAVDLCQTTTEGGDRWGVISASFTRTDGTGAPNVAQRAIAASFGASNLPLTGSTMAVLSTANAVDASGAGYQSFQFGTDMQGGQSGGNQNPSDADVPLDWLAANNGDLPNAPGCPEPAGTRAYDPVMLNLRVRVPTNARSFSIGSSFFSAEFPEWTCSPFNDFFVILLDSTFAGTPANPLDKNLAIYKSPVQEVYPVGVNLAHGDTGLFRVCKNGATGCMSQSTDGTISTCDETAGLTGTGFDEVATGNFVCEAGDVHGGGTGWLVTSGNVVPGEVIELRIALWDTSDPFFDSVVLLDSFRWSVEAAQPGTDIIVVD